MNVYSTYSHESIKKDPRMVSAWIASCTTDGAVNYTKHPETVLYKPEANAHSPVNRDKNVERL